MGELAGFSVEQEAALSVCEDRKNAAVQIIDAHNRMSDKVMATRRWWKVWR